MKTVPSCVNLTHKFYQTDAQLRQEILKLPLNYQILIVLPGILDIFNHHKNEIVLKVYIIHFQRYFHPIVVCIFI